MSFFRWHYWCMTLIGLIALFEYSRKTHTLPMCSHIACYVCSIHPHRLMLWFQKKHDATAVALLKFTNLQVDTLQQQCLTTHRHSKHSFHDGICYKAMWQRESVSINWVKRWLSCLLYAQIAFDAMTTANCWGGVYKLPMLTLGIAVFSRV